MYLSQNDLLKAIQLATQRKAAELESLREADGGCILVMLNYQSNRAMTNFNIDIKEICAALPLREGGTHTHVEIEHLDTNRAKNIPANAFAQAAAKIATFSAIQKDRLRYVESNSWSSHGLADPDSSSELAKAVMIRFMNSDNDACDHSLFDGAVIPKKEEYLKIVVSVVGGNDEDNRAVQDAAICAAEAFFGINCSKVFTAE